MTEDNKNKSNNEGILPTASRFTDQEKAVFAAPAPRIPGYRIVRTLGEGGMGMIYLADQFEPVKRRVAIKVIKPGMDSKQVIARFEAEKQALALLDHPGIATVYNAGTTEIGRPYFVMEYVKGIALTDHCEHYRLNIEERLKLFIQVCDAIGHAHQKGIIHRDIKPSNILVSIEHEKPILKIIDFGIAKAVSTQLTEQTLYTQQGQMIGTPDYMSPEQAEITNQDVDTRSDIYSLGVVLYELLTGVLPFDSQKLREAPLGELQKIIEQTDPPHPSTRLSSLGEQAKEVARKRQTDVTSLTRRLHKELEWIPLKAMRKERTHRYRSASELADDIKNYLTGAPLIAGPESTGYQFKKFINRNRVLVISFTIILAVIIVGAIVSTIFGIKESRARVIADTERKRATQSQQETQLANEKLIWENYVATLGVVQMRINDGQLPRAYELLNNCPVKQRGWEWGRLMRQNSPELLVIRRNEFEDRPKGSLHNALFTSDGQYILDDRPGLQRYSLIDLRTGKTVIKSKQYPGGGWRECTQIFPDNKHISYSSGYHTVDIIDYMKDKMVVRFDSGKGTLRSFVVSPDGKFAVGYNIVEKTGEREIIVWDTATAQELKRFQMESLGPSNIHQSEVNENNHENRAAKGWWIARLLAPVGRVLGFLPDNHSIVYADEHLTVLDIKTGQRKHLSNCRHWPLAYSVNKNIAAIYNPSSEHIELWDVVKGLKTTELERPTPHHFYSAISPDGKWVATGDSSSWDLWHGDTGKHVRTYHGSFNTISFSPSGTCAVTTHLSEIKIWSILAERNIQVKSFVDDKLQPVNFESVDVNNGVHEYSYNRKFLAIADIEGNIFLWKVPSIKPLKHWKCHAKEITSIAFSPDDKLLATTSVDGTAKIWKTLSGNLLHELSGVAGEVSRGVAFSHDGKKLAVGSGGQQDSKTQKIEGESKVQVFDVGKGNLLMDIAPGPLGIDVVAYSPDGKWLVIGRGYGGGVAGTISIVDAETGQQSFGEITDIGETRYISFSPDCRYMLALGMSLQPILWDLHEQREVWRLKNAETLQMAFHPDGDRFVTICNHKVAIHATKDGREIITLGYGLPPANFSSDGRQLIYRHDQGHMKILHSDDWTLPDKESAFKAALQNVQQELNLSSQ